MRTQRPTQRTINYTVRCVTIDAFLLYYLHEERGEGQPRLTTDVTQRFCLLDVPRSPPRNMGRQRSCSDVGIMGNVESRLPGAIYLNFQIILTEDSARTPFVCRTMAFLNRSAGAFQLHVSWNPSPIDLVHVRDDLPDQNVIHRSFAY